MDRVHRIGQTKDVLVKRFVCKGTVEERMIALHEKKRKLFDATILWNTNEKKKQTIEDFKFLLSRNNDLY